MTSAFEKHNDAIWLNGATALGEIAHIHPSDGSVHVVLSPTDAGWVLEAGRGELHPLVGKGGLSSTYMLLYSPITSSDVAVIRSILDAGVAYAEARRTVAGI